MPRTRAVSYAQVNRVIKGPARKPAPPPSDPALVRLVEALARWDADRDYAAAQPRLAQDDPSRPLRPL